MSSWFKTYPCPFHPSWGLDDISELDLHHLKLQIDTDNEESMVVEKQLYRAFLEYPWGKFYNQEREDDTEALRYIELAKKIVSTTFEGNIEAEIGYGIIIHTFHLWIRADREIEFVLRDFVAKKDDHPDHECYIHIVHAYFLSRLGPRWRSKALSLYELALEKFPNNSKWLFGKALMLGREARQMGNIKGWEHESVQDMLQKEMQVLKQILDLDPNFNLARAYYGQVLFSLGKQEAGKEISKALNNEPQNQSIAMVAVRYHRRNKSPFEWTERILKKLLETSDTAENNFQMGLLYTKKARSFRISERLDIWQTALNYFEKGVKLNNCHYPCYAKRAEMNALLGKTQQAKDLFKGMFENIYKDHLHHETSKILSLDTALEMRLPRHMRVFSTEEFIDLLHRYITLSAKQDDFDDKNVKVEQRLQKLSRICCCADNEDSVRWWATLKLADANRCLKRFKKAEELYLQLYLKNIELSYKAEITWGLGKCYFEKVFLDKTLTMASKLDRIDQDVFCASELYADVYLKRAKDAMETEAAVSANDLLQNLELAIEMHSLEASYLFLTSNLFLKNHFFDLKLRVPQILAKITIVLEEPILPIVHANFKLSMDDGSKVVHNEKKKKFAMKKKTNELLNYENFNNTDDPRNVLLDELKELRESRLKFELELTKRNSHENWNGSCAESLRSTVRSLRELLDHAISFYKESVLKDTSENCSFPVKFQERFGNVDKNRAREMINDWMSKTFMSTLPNETFTRILEVQPMYDKENIWLAALNELNNKLKHKNKVLYALEYFDLAFEKQHNIKRKTEASKKEMPPPSLRLKTEYIVRKSCKEVERLVLFFISRREDTTVIKKASTQEDEDEDDYSLENMFTENV